MLSFSIITPSYNYDDKRADDLARCHGSVINQDSPDTKWEHIIVDQTEKEDFVCDFEDAVMVTKMPHIERLFALRSGFQIAQGDWFCLLDSDDIYLPHYISSITQMITENPDAKMFNFGNIVIHKDGHVSTRDVFKPKALEVGHELFGGGQIVNGTFVFHRSVWEDLGDFPTTTEKLWNPWDFSIAAQEEFPELQQFFMVDHEDEPEKIAKELGNPWGQDFYLFYKYTRKYHSIPVNKHLYAVYAKM